MGREREEGMGKRRKVHHRHQGALRTVDLIQVNLPLETRIDRLLPLLAHPLLPVHRSFGHREVRQQKGTALGQEVEMEKLREGRNGIVHW